MYTIQNGKVSAFVALFFLPILSASATEVVDIELLFKQKCAFCHAIDKKGPLGPAINSMSRERDILRGVIIKGENSMPGYGGKLSSAEIEALVGYLLANQ